MSNQTMRARDTVCASMAECYLTVDGRRYNFMQAINLTAKFTKHKQALPILGRTGYGNKACGWSGTGQAKFYYNTSLFRTLMRRYKDSGEDVCFDIQITNEDPASSAGRQTIILRDCSIDSGILAKFDAGSDYLDETLTFTFEDFTVPEEFNILDGTL